MHIDLGIEDEKNKLDDFYNQRNKEYKISAATILSSVVINASSMQYATRPQATAFDKGIYGVSIPLLMAIACGYCGTRIAKALNGIKAMKCHIQYLENSAAVSADNVIQPDTVDVDHAVVEANALNTKSHPTL